ncbi:MAG: 3-oxoacyl-[acyl-carrier-protein] reductase [Candidatus Omnitrophota bacterium]|nr:3-oxoacyl-[acyl-carrier-protein] reductase [Candidatus Omnitrophota bacterium]
MDLKGKVAIVTGGSRGIGREIVLALAKKGCFIAFNYFKNESLAESLIKEVKSLNTKAIARMVDIRDFEKVKLWVEDVKREFGQLDILINNAGIINDKALMLMEPVDWQEVIKINLIGVFNVTRACIVTFLKQKSGNIVNISSVSGITGTNRQTNYSASKAGIIGFTKSLAKEVAAFNIKVNAVAPGYIETDMLSNLKEDYKQQLLNSIPMNRFGKSAEVANVVLFLLSQQASYITGQVIVVDGGLSMK